MTETPGTSSQIFQRQVDCWTLEEVNRGTIKFGDLVRALPGVYPSSVLDSLRRLSARNVVPDSIVEGAILGATEGTSTKEGRAICTAEMPTPHPLDYDWRFADATARDLLDTCLDHSRRNDLIALLGAPSVFCLGMKSSYGRGLVLLDRNPAYVKLWEGNSQRVIQCDFSLNHPPRLAARVALADPPWYPDFQTAFLTAAARVVEVGGFVFMTVPPMGTRPGVYDEWSCLVQWSQRVGLQYFGMCVSCVSYVSPFFERNSLRVEGVNHVPDNWRRANLAMFRKVESTNTNFGDRNSAQSEWFEESHFGFRVRKKPSGESHLFVNPELISILPKDVLPSVSRKDSRRDLADVWTIGNRIFACKGTSIFLGILKALDRGSSPESEVVSILGRDLEDSESTQIRNAIRQVSNIIGLETDEQLGLQQ